ncbi:MAG: aminopeptidase P family protein [Acidimicrobiales bacterium]
MTQPALSTAGHFADRLRELPPILVDKRIALLRLALAESELDALLVTAPTNIRYLTGFTGSSGVVAVTADSMVLITDGRYSEQAAAQLSASQAPAMLEITSTKQRDILTSFLMTASTVGLEADHITWSTQLRYADDWFANRDVVATSGIVEQLRRSKDAAELARMELAAAIADAALAERRSTLLDGLTESQFAVALDSEMRGFGASGTSFDTIVASGPNGAMPHARPTSRRISDGDLVVLDFGCIVDGYCSDMTRTVAIGEVDTTCTRMLEVVTAANAAGVAMVRPGVSTAQIDAAARAVIAAAGWADAFTHGTGHGVGLDIHEAPRVGGTSTDTLEIGDVVTVEPGVYLPAHGGVRMEDSVVVTPDGCRTLTHTTKSPQP